LDFLHHLYYYPSLTVLYPVHGLFPLSSYVIDQNLHHYYCCGLLDAGGCDHVRDALVVTCYGGDGYLSLMLQPQKQEVSAGLRCTRSLQINAAMCNVQLNFQFFYFFRISLVMKGTETAVMKSDENGTWG